MADWRQIQARIRKAKNSLDPSAKLSDLYQRTRDALVALELGAIEEKAARTGEAAKWYTIAAQRFRRADWKKKAEEALTRIGAPIPEGAAAPSAEPRTEASFRAEAETAVIAESAAVPLDAPEPGGFEAGRASLALGEISEDASPQELLAPAPATLEAAEHGKKRRRGRRGGRGRGHRPAGLPSRTFAETSSAKVEAPAAHPVFLAPARTAPVEPPAPLLPSERIAHGRAGDPALASRMAFLESLLRRLVASPLHRLDEADEAPAGPGVFLISDSDQVTSYYVEACQTLRIGIGNLTRGRRGKSGPGGRGHTDSELQSRLADYLGISEAKVSQYLKDHCVVRWIQLDDEAPQLAHFAIALLRTPLNLE